MQFESRTLKTAPAEPSITPTVVSWILAGIGMILALHLHLLSALLPGLLVYVLVRLLAPRIQKRLAGRTARLIALVALATVTMGIPLRTRFEVAGRSLKGMTADPGRLAPG